MPLKCLDQGKEIFAFNVGSDADWDALRRTNAESRSLEMPCCGAAVVLRTSKLGTRHFAHARRGPCSTALESAEHLLAKMRIVEGIRQTDWQAASEQSGESPSGEAWRADVLATRGTKRVAFEVQWSRQDEAETQRRQALYKAANVRGLWLFRQADFAATKEVPVFQISFDEAGKSFQVLIPRARNRAPKNTEDDATWAHWIPLPEFVAGALNGRLVFAPARGRAMPLRVEVASTICPRCQKSTGFITGVAFVASRVLRGHPDIRTTIYALARNLPNGIDEVIGLLPPSLLHEHQVGPIVRRRIVSTGDAYLAIECIHCGSPFGEFLHYDHDFSIRQAFEVDAIFKTEWIEHLEDLEHEVCRWWFDETSVQVDGTGA